MSSLPVPERARNVILAVVLPACTLAFFVPCATAGERTFVVMLANSPKQYPGPDRDPPGLPTGGLVNRQLIQQQYFDAVSPNIGSFAEYWEEISYGDVTIAGNVFDWVNLPWAIQPPLVDPLRDDPLTGPPVDDDINDLLLRNSPANFYDLNDSGMYEYGRGERFDNSFAASIIDINGDPSSGDDGPFHAGPGSFHHTESPFFYPVWKPGERFVDMDEDGRWDGLDEANNQMDWLPWDAPDGVPDLLGPWVDLNEDGYAENELACVYLPDGDNDGNPDCCPDGPGLPGCEAYDPDAAFDQDYKEPCPPTMWNRSNGEIQDCNGNLIPDACDLSCTSTACERSGWLESPYFIDTGMPCRFDGDCDTARGFGCDPETATCKLCGASRDDLPWTASAGECVALPNMIPDECEFAVLDYPNQASACVEEELGPDDPCMLEGIFLECIRQPDPRIERMAPRCEFDDVNEDDELDVVEPFENFLRRWDPCIYDPDVSPNNINTVQTHWVKVYDPSSPNADEVLACDTDSHSFSYGDDSYIRHNYPGRGKLCSESRIRCETDADCFVDGEECRTGVEELIDEAGRRPLFGSHDPDDKLTDLGVPCVCPLLPCISMSDCTILSELGGAGSICAGRETCRRDSDCPSGVCVNPDGSDDGTDLKYCAENLFCTCVQTYQSDGTLMPNVCLAGHHAELDPPDRWFNVIADNGPSGTLLYTTKMQAEPNVGKRPGLLDEITPKPGTYVSPITGRPIDEPWYQQAWRDRYHAAACPNPEFDQGEPVGPENPQLVPCECDNPDFAPTVPEGPDDPRTVACEPPPWPGEDQPELVRNVPRVIPFDDVDPLVYQPTADRRFFKANAGGLNGDGTGWIDCGSVNHELVVFETGDLNGIGFEEACNAAILPEEVNGASEPAIFYDGWVEHDDLSSSKYHRMGDERLGEVTSPFISTVSHQPLGVDPLDPPDPIQVAAIWGQDIGVGQPSPYGPDGIIPAAGPYAVDIHGNFGRDAGNTLLTELLTWRTEPPFNNGAMWELDPAFESRRREHPYAGPLFGPNLGFRDYNLDGLIDQGEVRPAGSENYIADTLPGTPDDGVRSGYPFNRRRLMEDVVEIVDVYVDFDDLVDSESLDRINCPGGHISAVIPPDLTDQPGDVLFPDGVCSGMVLLPPGSHTSRDFQMPARYYPIHTEDGAADSMLPSAPDTGQIGWSLFFHDLVRGLEVEFIDNIVPSENYQRAYAAHMYLHTWEGFPDLYDYDVYEGPGAIINCPVGEWGVMARGGLVHPVAPLKERPCTEWAKSVDLATVLVPGVEQPLTLPPAEFVRDAAYYSFWNDDDPYERYYFWSAGSGFDENMPGEGVLILHSYDTVVPLPWPLGWPWYRNWIIQADGLGELDVCSNYGDDGDPWPGSTGNTTFTCDTNPSSRWRHQRRCTGLDILDINPVSDGSNVLRLRWTPTNLPSLAFTQPPGGESVPFGDEVLYQIRVLANDIFGGTSMRFFFVLDGSHAAIHPDGSNYVGDLAKMMPGSMELALDWNIANLPDGLYRVFAELIPGDGTDGTEPAHTTPRPGFYNVGDGTLTVDHVAVNEIVTSGDAGFLLTPAIFVATDEHGQFINFVQAGVHVGDQFLFDEIVADPTMRTVSGIAPDGLSLFFEPEVTPMPLPAGGPWSVVKPDRNARLETWVAECIAADGFEWIVTSSLSQPRPSGNDPNQDPYPHAFTGAPYTSIGGEVTFTIEQGAEPFAAGDTFTFVTTGITAVSAPVMIYNGGISQDPVAIIQAHPRAGAAPLEVSFDGRSSFDPNGDPLEFRWDFGDGSPLAEGAEVTHVFAAAQYYTVVLRATNPMSGRFGESWTTILVRSPGARLGDWDHSFSIDWADYAELASCLDLSGPNEPPSDVRCIEVFDFDGDWDVDLVDFDGFLAVFAQE